MELPAVTAEQMREVDRVMMEDLGISLSRMMENAGRGLAQLARERFAPRSVTVLAGPGGNGGGGITAARHLANRGLDVVVVPSEPANRMAEVPRAQLEIAGRVGVAVVDEPRAADLVIDAVLGYSARGDPRGRAGELIAWANEQGAPLLSLDTPSGLDVTTGAPGKPTVRATATLTIAMAKTGLLVAPGHVGELWLVDISVPPSVYEAFGMHVEDPFVAGSVVRIG